MAAAEEAAEAGAAEWAGATALIPEANGSSIDTAAAIGRKCSSTERVFPGLCAEIVTSVDCFSSLKGEEKRGGGGSHNWGTVKDELK